jgi:FSR family fosmidomycin resistance protein-like MFS transporter
MVNDTLQALLQPIYPLLKASFGLTFTQIGMITFCFQLTASVLQPVVGRFTDRHPKPYSLACGMAITLVGLACLSRAPSYTMIVLSAVLIGLGSAIFHPEASRVAHMAAGERYGLAQSVFQTGGNLGSSLGPLLAAWIIVPHGQSSILWFTLLALAGVVLLSRVGRWYKHNLSHFKKRVASHRPSNLSRRRVVMTLGILIALIFSKYFYLVSLSNYYTFYVIQKFHLTIPQSLHLLFIFLASVAVGTIVGGPLGDRFGRKIVIWVSILGVAPFSILMPHVGLGMTVALTVVIGLILASAFSAILVYAQELVPGKVGMISGLFFGLAFGCAGIAAAALGNLADHKGIEFVFNLCGYLPLIGLLAWFLPDIEASSQRARRLERESTDLSAE